MEDALGPGWEVRVQCSRFLFSWWVLEVGEQDCNLMVPPGPRHFGEQEWLAKEKAAEKGRVWHLAHRQTLGIPPKPHTPLSTV